MSAEKFAVILEPVGQRIKIKPDNTILDAAREAGIHLSAICGGDGTCGKCLLRLDKGKLTPVTKTEKEIFNDLKIDGEYRLACMAKPLTDVTVFIPQEGLTATQRLQIEGIEEKVEVSPAVKSLDVEIIPPTINDQRSDSTRVLDHLTSLGLNNIKISTEALRSLSDKFRDQKWRARLVINRSKLIAILPQNTTLFGIAVDIGTTKMAAYLINIEDGNTVAKTGSVNPQISYGDDVVSRIAYADKHENGRHLLQLKLVESLNKMINELCQKFEVYQDQIVDIVVVGNTAMHHFFAGFPVIQLGLSPYIPAVKEAIELDSKDIGLNVSTGSSVYLPPNIAGYVGADHVAMLLATNAHKARQITIAIDLGTNTEVSLISNDKILSCSCASGPAFEGAHIKHGMRAIPGAIERVQIHNGSARVQTVDDEPPVGICGSGILDAVAELYRAGLINYSGSFAKDNPGIKWDEKGGSFCLVTAENSGNNRDICVTRSDINEILLAKAAIRTGIEILLQEAKLSGSDIESFIMAGAFGTYIDISNAIEIGMLPDLPTHKFDQVGNAAGIGAKKMLISEQFRREADDLLQKIQYVELTSQPDFFDIYTNELIIKSN